MRNLCQSRHAVTTVCRVTRRDTTKTSCSNLPDAHPKAPRKAWKTTRNLRPKTKTRPITARTATTMVSNYFRFSLTILASLNNCTVHICWTTVSSQPQWTVFRPTRTECPTPVPHGSKRLIIFIGQSSKQAQWCVRQRWTNHRTVN